MVADDDKAPVPNPRRAAPISVDHLESWPDPITVSGLAHCCLSPGHADLTTLWPSWQEMLGSVSPEVQRSRDQRRIDRAEAPKRSLNHATRNPPVPSSGPR